MLVIILFIAMPLIVICICERLHLGFDEGIALYSIVLGMALLGGAYTAYWFCYYGTGFPLSCSPACLPHFP
jgi:hypothetical protein